MTREVRLGDSGFVALVDDADFERVNALTWKVTSPRAGVRYAIAQPQVGARRLTIRMHRFILGVGPGDPVDHRNGDGLDNRRGNLRDCTQKQNTRNRRRQSNNTSGFKGVAASDGRWRSYIVVDGKWSRLGTYADPIEAARAYDRAAVQHFGEFARLNFSQDRDWLFPHEHRSAWPPLAA